MCAPPSEKPLCFSCLSVCIVVQGKRHTQFLLRRFSIWRCPLYFIDLCKVDHSIQHWDQFQVVILNLFSEVFAAALNLFLPIKTKILIQLNPVILNTGIPHSPLFRTNVHFTWFCYAQFTLGYSEYPAYSN